MACSANAFTPSTAPSDASKAMAMRNLIFLGKVPSARANELVYLTSFKSSGSIFSKIFNGCSAI
jgi:hypothetical protein